MSAGEYPAEMARKMANLKVGPTVVPDSQHGSGQQSDSDSDSDLPLPPRQTRALEASLDVAEPTLCSQPSPLPDPVTGGVAAAAQEDDQLMDQTKDDEHPVPSTKTTTKAASKKAVPKSSAPRPNTDRPPSGRVTRSRTAHQRVQPTTLDTDHTIENPIQPVGNPSPSKKRSRRPTQPTLLTGDDDAEEQPLAKRQRSDTTVELRNGVPVLQPRRNKHQEGSKVSCLLRVLARSYTKLSLCRRPLFRGAECWTSLMEPP